MNWTELFSRAKVPLGSRARKTHLPLPLHPHMGRRDPWRSGERRGRAYARRNGTTMSRAFVKEPDGDDGRDELPERPISSHPNLVTAEGLAHINAEISRLQAAHAAAQATDERGALARTARDLRYWNARRASAQLVPPPTDKAQVHFGSIVTIVRDDGRKQTFRIVGEDEADP